MAKRRSTHVGATGPAQRQYVRHDNVIYQAAEEGGIARDDSGNKIVVESFNSINAAKRKSLELQKSNGGVGAGAVSVL